MCLHKLASIRRMTWELSWVEWAGRYLSNYQISTLEAPKKSLLDLINASTSFCVLTIKMLSDTCSTATGLASCFIKGCAPGLRRPTWTWKRGTHMKCRARAPSSLISCNLLVHTLTHGASDVCRQISTHWFTVCSRCLAGGGSSQIQSVQD